MPEGTLDYLLRASVPLVFARCGITLYARTPGGEIAFGDATGLYEWRDGERIHYSGGDRQGSSCGGFWTRGAGFPGAEDRPRAEWPDRRGYVASLSRRRLN